MDIFKVLDNICKGGRFTKDIIMIYRDCSGNKVSIICGGMDVALRDDNQGILEQPVIKYSIIFYNLKITQYMPCV